MSTNNVNFYRGDHIGDLTSDKKKAGSFYVETSDDSASLYYCVNDGETPVPLTNGISKEEFNKKLEGFSSKYNITQKGWHRVLNTIRGNGGTLSLTLTDGFSLQSITIDMRGFVKWVNSSDAQVAKFIQSSYQELLPNPQQSDEYFKTKITNIRIGYPSQNALTTKFDTEVSIG